MKYQEDRTTEENIRKVFINQLMPDQNKAKLDDLISKKIAEYKTIKIDGTQSNSKQTFVEKLQMFLSGGFKPMLFMSGFAVVAVLIIGILLTFVNNKTVTDQQNQLKLAIAPLALSSNGVDPDAKFTITSDQDIDSQEIQKQLVTSPEFAFTVEKIDDNYQIIPEQNLEQGQTYSMTLPAGSKIAGVELMEDLNWKFNVRPKFSVTGTTPRNGVYDVPISTAIEIEFNYKDLNLNSFKNKFSIYPQIEIKEFMQVGTKIVIVPKQQIKKDTMYSVVLEAGVKRQNGEATNKLTKFYFKTSNDIAQGVYPPYINLFQSGFISPVSAVTKKVGIYIEDRYTPQGAKVNLYQVKSSSYDDAVAQMLKLNHLFPYANSKIDDKYLQKIDEKTLLASDINKQITLTFEKVQNNQLYLVEAIYKNKSEIGYYASSDYAANISETSDQYLISAFDKQGKLIEDQKNSATLYYLDKNQLILSKKIEIKDISQFDKTDEQKIIGLVLKIGQNNLVISNISFDLDQQDSDFERLYQNGGMSYQNKLMAYYRFDKPVYRTGDQVQFKVTLRDTSDFVNFNNVDLEGISYEVYSNDVLISQGQFEQANTEHSYLVGRFNIPAFLEQDPYFNTQIRLVKDHETISVTQFSVYEYYKPKYTIDLEIIDKKLYKPGDQLQFKITAMDLAGKPLLNRKININLLISDQGRELWYDDQIPVGTSYGGDLYKSYDVDLDAAGSATINEKIPDTSNKLIDTYGISIEAILDQQYYTNDGVTVLRGDTIAMLKPSKNYYDNNEQIKIELKTVNPFTFKPQSIKDGSLSLIRHYSVPEQIGEKYNEFTKQVEPIYRYIAKEETVISNQKFDTDQNGNKQFEFKFANDGSYFVNVSLKDTTNKTITNQQYIFSIFENIDSDDYISYPYIQTDKENYEIGEEVIVNIDFDKNLIENQDAYLIIYKNKFQKLEKFKIDSTNKKFTIKLDKELTPKFRIGLIMTSRLDFLFKYDMFSNASTERKNIWDNIRYVYSTNKTVTVANQKKLNISLQDLSTVYQPGEKIKFKVLVKDKNKSAVADANLTVNIFDKSLLLALGQTDYQPDIYQQIYNKYKITVSNLVYPQNVFMGGGGDGGGERMLRDNLKEQAIFATDIVTDKNGEAVIELTLPENLTTWVLDVESFTQKMQIGNLTQQFKVQKELVVDFEVPQYLHSGDQVTIPVYFSNFGSKSIDGLVDVEVSDNLKVASFDKGIKLPANSTQVKNLRLTVKKNAVGEGKITVKLVKSANNKLLDGYVQRVELFAKGNANQSLITGKVNTGDPIKIVLPNDAKQINTVLSLVFDPLTLALTPSQQTYATVPDMTSGTIHDLSLLQNYQRFSSQMTISQSGLEQKINLNIQSILQLQDTASGGFATLSYDAVDIETSAFVAMMIHQAKLNNVAISEQRISKLADYLALQVYNKNAKINNKTSIDQKVMAAWGLAAVSDPRGLNYALEIKQQLDSIKSATTLAFLADAFYLAGSNGDAREILAILNTKLILEQDYAYFKDSEAPYKNLSSDRFTTVLAYKVYLEVNSQNPLIENIERWIFNNLVEFKNGLETSLAYAVLLTNRVPLEQQNADVNINLNTNQLFNGQLTSDKSLVIQLSAGENILEINTDKTLYYKVSNNFISQKQLNNNKKFEVKTTFQELGGSISNSFDSAKYVRMRIEVKTLTDVDSFDLKSYLPAGLIPTIWNPNQSFLYDQTIFDWYKYIRNEKNLSTYGLFSNDYIHFFGPGLKSGNTYKFEVLLISKYPGVYSTNGSLVYQGKINSISGYETGQIIEIK